MIPNVCPNCGYELNVDTDIKIVVGFFNINLIFEVYCSNCNWSGDIIPDD